MLSECADESHGVRLVVTLAALLLVAPAASFPQEDVPDFSGVSGNPYPLCPAISNPVLTGADVTDGPAYLVADPFLFHEDGIWYMFFEAYVGWGRIGLASSADGLVWTYDRIILSESWHLSFPYVFEADGHHYMTPECSACQAVNLYEADAFPYSWHQVATLVSGRNFVDPVVFRRQGTW